MSTAVADRDLLTESEGDLLPHTEEELEDDLGDEGVVKPLRYSITSYGADYPVDGLVARLRNGSILVPPFQRGYVWSQQRASRFIESLLLGLPVPGIFLATEAGANKLLVIDGQQRLRTLQYFYEGIIRGHEFALSEVQPQFEGKTYKTLSDEDRVLLDDAILHATIVKQDETSDDDSSVYQIFERLNTGGVLLRPQEIRAAVCHGAFNDLLHELNETQAWRSLFGEVSPLMRDQELVLRFLALYLEEPKYRKPMSEFLNRFMMANRDLEVYPAEELRPLFRESTELIAQELGRKAFRVMGGRVLNAAVFDAVMVGVAHRLKNGAITDAGQFVAQHSALLANPRFNVAVQVGTADEESVEIRLSLAREAFDGVR